MKKYNNVIVADLETSIVNQTHVPIALGFYTGKQLKIYNAQTERNLVEGFLTSLLNLPGDKLIYLHNFARFDSFFLIRGFLELGLKPEMIIRDGQVYSLILKVGKTQLHFKDSYLTIPFSLEKAAKLFNHHHFKTEISLDKLANWQANLTEIENYLKNDLLTLYELVIRFNAFMQHNFKAEIYYTLTLPSLSQKIFLTQFYTGKYINLSANQDEFIRASYLGGVVDVYRPEGKDLVVLDFNSMYPAIMARTKFGTGRAKFIHEVNDLYSFCQREVAFVKVKVTCRSGLRLPLLALKFKQKNIQPTGTFIVTVYSKEILYCLDHYPDFYKFEFISAAYFEETACVFSGYINQLYALRVKYRSNKDEAGEKLIKLMMNSLYGRFGIKVYDNQTKLVDDKEANTLLANEYLNTLPLKVVSDKLSVITYENSKARKDLLLKQFKSRVDWAAIITAEGRMLMQRLKSLVDVLYSDTDSLVIERKDLPKLIDWIDPDKLGYLKVEGEYTYGIFIAPKVYLLKKNDQYIIKIKGVKYDGLTLSPSVVEEFFRKKLQENESGVSISIERVKDFVRNHQDFTIHTAREMLNITLDYDKREKIYHHGIWVDTKPLHLNEDETGIGFYDD